jgi:OmpA-OmpF porin, OOP family
MGSLVLIWLTIQVRHLAYMNPFFFSDTFVINHKIVKKTIDMTKVTRPSGAHVLRKKMTHKANQSVQKRQNFGVVGSICTAFLGLVLGVGAWAQAPNVQYSQIEPFGQVFAQASRVVDQQTRMIFYRARQTNAVEGAASIYVNGAYHASLIPGGYSTLCMPAGAVELGLKSVEVGRTVKEDLDTITVIRAAGGQDQYFRVKEVGRGRQMLQPVAMKEALTELSGTREQIHTISRVPGAGNCTINAMAPAAGAGAPQTVTLAADALFAFARSDFYAISPMGRASLDALIQRLRGEYIQIDRLHIVGHADPLGQALSNDRLSVDRAQTVRDYLYQSGLNTVQMSSEGRGSREPVATHCGVSLSPQAIACHAPNRRVAIEIVGARR